MKANKGDTLIGVGSRTSLLRPLRRPLQGSTPENLPITRVAAICNELPTPMKINQSYTELDKTEATNAS